MKPQPVGGYTQGGSLDSSKQKWKPAENQHERHLSWIWRNVVLPPGHSKHFITGTSERKISFVQTVKENSLPYTRAQLTRALAARQMYIMVGRPSMRDFKAIVKNHFLPNNPITIQDMEVAEKVYGKDMGSIQQLWMLILCS